MKPKFEPTQRGVEIIDPIERHRYHLETREPVSLEPADDDAIGFPIGSITRFRTDTLELPKAETVFVRDSEGAMLAEVTPAEQVAFRPGEYTLDLSGPLKIYARIENSVQIFSDGERTYVNFGSETDVLLGARSFHERPAGTITTTADPTDVMDAVSAFSSALKTTTPERAYPTLRGHPPRLEFGDSLCVPTEFDRPESGVRIEVPATLRHAFVVAPLAYYLGANVTPGSEPKIVTETGYSYPLEADDGFEPAVRSALKRTFFLDCVVRTEGKTPLQSHERRSVERALEFDIAETYSCPHAERIERYLEVSDEALVPHLPDWQFETRLEPSPENVEFLSFLANDLVMISTERTGAEPTPTNAVAEEAIEEFTRADFVRSTRPQSVRGTDDATTALDSVQAPTVQQSWTGIDDAEILSTTPLAAYRNNIGRTPKDGPIEIDVVCNDPDMREELESVNGTYGSREDLPFETTIHYDLSTDALESVLGRESDFLHYIGHIDDGGFRCSDGKLDASTVETVGVKAFLLNACQSHEQGLHLIDAGSVGGIVTLGDVVNSGAVSIGSLIAQLLNSGFPLYGALDIAREESIVGQQYLMVGNGRTTIAQSETRAPNVCSATDFGSDVRVALRLYAPAEIGRGGVFSPYIGEIDEYYVFPREIDGIVVTERQFVDFLDEALFPVLYDGNVHWSKDLLQRYR